MNFDRRTEYRIVLVPSACRRWIAQYRRWWSPFWATHRKVVGICKELGPTFVTRYFETADEAVEWCAGHAKRETRESKNKLEPKTVIELGRLP